MKNILILVMVMVLSVSCHRNSDKEELKNAIFTTEKEFEKMTADKGIAESFYFFADENAVILRERDTLIHGKENIRNYYEKKNLRNVTLHWTPDFIEVSDDGTLGYTYGKYSWKVKSEDGSVKELKGVFHTVWKKQKDHTWRYLWD
ncbi:MAG: YybH family protein [Syntrophothermus sp.]